MSGSPGPSGAARRAAMLSALAWSAATGPALAWEHLNARWPQSSMPIGYSIDASVDVPDLAGDLELEEVRSAFNEWQDEPGSRVTFEEVDPGVGSVHVSFGHSLGTGVLGTCALSTASGPSAACGTSVSATIRGATIRVSGWHAWASHDAVRRGDCQDQSDLHAIALHEIGHAIGLDHSPFAYASMAALHFQCAIWNGRIGPDDIAGIRGLYCHEEPFFEVRLASVDDSIDSGCSDLDGCADGGERAALALLLTNHGPDVGDVTLRLGPSGPFVHPLAPIAVGDVAHGASVEARLGIEMDLATVPGATVDVRLALDSAAGTWSQVAALALPVQRARSIRHVHVEDRDMPTSAWTATPGWVRIDDPCTLPDADAPWRTSRRADCNARYDAGRATLRGLIDLPEDPGERQVTLTVRQAWDLPSLGDRGELRLGRCLEDLVELMRVEGTSPWETSPIVLSTYRRASDPQELTLRFMAGSGSGMGWSIDSVELDWDVEELPPQAAPTCTRPCRVEVDGVASATGCVGETVVVSAGAARVLHCAGAPLVRWRLGTVVLRDFDVDPDLTYVIDGDATLSLDAACSTDAACIASTDVDVVAIGPPVPVGSTLRVARDPSGVVLTWRTPSDGSLVDVRRAPLGTLPAEPPVVEAGVTADRHVDPATATEDLAYVVTAVGACGSEDPIGGR